MAAQIANFGIQTYVALPITTSGIAREQIRNLGAEYQTRCRDRVFRPVTDNPCIIAGSFYAKDMDAARRISKRIQEVVAREFERFATTGTELVPYDLVNCSPNPEEKAKDYVGVFVRDEEGQRENQYEDRFDRIAKIIHQSGGEMADPLPVPEQVRHNTVRLRKCVLIGEVRPCRGRAVPRPYQGAFWSGDRSMLWPPTSPRNSYPKMAPIEVDPKHLLFFSKDGRPENFHNLDLQNPLTFSETETPKALAMPAPAENSKPATQNDPDAVMNGLIERINIARRQLTDLKDTHALLAREGEDVTHVQADIDALRRTLAIAAADLNKALNPAANAPVPAPATEMKAEYCLGDEFRAELTKALERAEVELRGHSSLDRVRQQVSAVLRRSMFRSRDEAVDQLNRVYSTVRDAGVASDLTGCIGRKLSSMTEEGMV